MLHIIIFSFTLLASCVSNSFEPIVTLIAPFHAQEPIESFFNMITSQPYFKMCHLIMVGNESAAYEVETIKKYQYTYRNIDIIHANLPTSVLVNEALLKSNAPYVSLIRIHDYTDPQTFLAQLNALKENNDLDVVYSDYYTTYSIHTPTAKADNWYLNELPEYEPQWLYRNVPGPQALWRKSLHKKIGYLNPHFQFHYMWEFWNRCGKNNIGFKKIHGTPGTYYFNYFDQKKILTNTLDFAQSYEEEKYIKQNYESLWNCGPCEQKKFVIITASYNNKDWYERNLDSVLNQEYSNYRIIYIDDKSPDQTGALVKDYIEKHNKQHLVTLIINDTNIGALANIYNAIHSCKKDEICVLVDGDDALSHNHVLQHLNTVYQDPYVWLTYGQFEWFPERMPGFVFQLPGWVVEKNSIRDYLWVTSHLRTFYAGLFQKIKKEDLMFEGEFFSKAWDLGIMYPMVEMAAHHCRFISEILYSYNTANQINDNKVNLTLQDRIDKFIRRQERYTPIAHWSN